MRALLPLFRLVGVHCIAALRRVEKPPAAPQQSSVTEFLGPRKAANTRSGKRPGKTGEALPGLNAGRSGYSGGGAAQHLQSQIKNQIEQRKIARRCPSGRVGPYVK